MTIHREGFKILSITLVLMILINYFIGLYDFMFFVASFFISLLIFCFMLFFFRSPNIKIKHVPNSILSPSDGTVVSIDRVYEGIYFKEEMVKISIFLSAFNVHVIRYPISGVVEFIKYCKGKYLLAWHPKSSESNENNIVVINNDKLGKVMFKKIAGFVARRISDYSKLKSNVYQGGEAGFIKFGSRVDIFFPLEWKVLVNDGQVVKGAKTRIAKKNIK